MKHKTNRHEKIIKKNVINPHAIDNTVKMMMADAVKKVKIGGKKYQANRIKNFDTALNQYA